MVKSACFDAGVASKSWLVRNVQHVPASVSESRTLNTVELVASCLLLRSDALDCSLRKRWLHSVQRIVLKTTVSHTFFATLLPMQVI